jgi:hypothetical protein
MKITKSKLKELISKEISQIAEAKTNYGSVGPKHPWGDEELDNIVPGTPLEEPRAKTTPGPGQNMRDKNPLGAEEGEIIMGDEAGQSGAEKKPAGKEEKVYPDVQRALKQIEDKVMGFLKRVDMRMEKQQFVKLFLDYLNMIPADLIRIAKGDIEQSKTRGKKTPIGTSQPTLATESKNIRVKYRKK